MKKINIKFLFLFILIFIPQLVFGQGNVTVQLQQPPPFQFHVEDLWKVTLNNVTPNTYNIYLHGVLTKSGGEVILGGNTAVFRLDEQKMVLANEIGPIDVNKKYKAYQDSISNTGSLPAGEYEICVTVHNADKDEILGKECITYLIEKTSAGIITLISPSNGEEMKPDGGINFVWTGTGLKGPYTLYIYEIRGNQSCDGKTNDPKYTSENIRSTSYQYPKSAPKLEAGKKYCWKITGKQEGVVIESTPMSFSIKKSIKDEKK